jgi:phosphoglucosamine mutase
VALDGDADRVVLVDDRGQLIDGDQVLALIAQSWRADQRLKGEAVVATVMSNLGLEKYLGGLGLTLRRTTVGDRYVVERMRADGCNVGGEQSGHIVLSDFATTGDGLLAALQVLAVVRQQDQRASEVTQVFAPLPQRLNNVRVERKVDLAAPEIATLLDRERARLRGSGRLLVRASGTEPVVRVMVEAEDEALLADVLETVSREIGNLAVRAA